MKQTIFDVRQRAEELLTQALAIWRQSDQSEYLEGLESDPVFQLLLTALAYQSNELDSEIEQLKVDVLQELEHSLAVGELGRAIPATVVVRTALLPKVSELTVTSAMTFRLVGRNQKSYSFIPLLATRLVNAEVRSVTRLDGRRWLVSLDCLQSPVKQLQGMTFAIDNVDFHSLRISVADSGQEVPLIAPWDFANLPVTEAFSLDTLLYNRACTSGSRVGLSAYNHYGVMDLFARQQMGIFVVDQMEEMDPHDRLDLLFEFDGIADDFQFSFNRLHLNAMVLVNAEEQEASLSTASPSVRLTGSAEGSRSDAQFLHLIRPSADQLYGQTALQVRRVSADRFNRGRLVKLLQNLLARYHSDYYAFQTLNAPEVERVVARLRDGFEDLLQLSMSDRLMATEGVYLQLRANSGVPRNQKEPVSLTVHYLITQGATLNSVLNREAKFEVPAGLNAEQTIQIAAPQGGMNEVRNELAQRAMTRYYLTTEDRLVTETDLKLFCQMELIARFGMVEELISSIRTRRCPYTMGSYHTYQIVVQIQIKPTQFTRRAFEGKQAGVEHYLQRMMEVRTTGLYPIRVELKLETK